MSLRIKRWGWQQSVLLAGALCLNVDVRAASADDEKADENRWDIFKDGKDRLKFDKQSGDMYRLERDDSSALVWVKVTVRVTTVASTKPKSAAPVIQPDENAQASTTEEKPKRPKSAAPEIFDTEGNNITDVITDFDRRQSAPAIVAYEKNLSVCNAVQIGDRIPSANLTRATDDGPKPATTDDIFAGKTVALFAVPGAFTPTCSARHLPGFKDHRAEMVAKGIDTIACVSVNDAFVMGAWADSQGIGKDDIVMLGDGNGDFTRQLGLSMDAKGFGMGERSQRYSMLVRDGVVEQLNIEQGGEFKVSSAEHLLAQL